MIRAVADGVEIAFQVQPRASRTELQGVHDHAIKLRLAAPPVDGEANEELIRFLAKRLAVPQRAVTIVSGATGKKKRVRVAGVSVDTVASRLVVEG